MTDAAHLVVSDVEAAEYYVNNADDFPEGQEAAKAKIHNLVREEKIQEKRQAFARSLRKNARIAIFLAPPSAQDATEPLSRPQPTTVAEVNGKKITARELDESVQPRLATLEPRFYLMKRRVLEEMINEVLSAEEAKKRGVSQEELFESVTQVTAVAIPEETIEKIYKRMTTKEKPADPQQLRNEIRRRLQRRQVKPQWEEFLQALKAKATIKINLPAPAFS